MGVLGPPGYIINLGNILASAFSVLESRGQEGVIHPCVGPSIANVHLYRGNVIAARS